MEYPRDLAVRALGRVIGDREPLDEVLNELFQNLGREERAWFQEVCSGTLRWKGRVDLALDASSLRKKPTGWLRKTLSVAAYQLIAQDRTPAGRVVSETVDQVKKKEGPAPARFANAVLRKISDHAASWRDLPFDPKAHAKDQANWASLPEWIWNRIVKQHGLEWAKAYALASLERPDLWIRVRSGAKAPEGSESGPIAESYKLARGAGSITEREGFGAGDFFVQDISSQKLVHEIALEVRKRSSGSHLRALDLCAAPGGKSAGLSWDGFEMRSTDLAPERMALLRESLQRVAPQARVLARDEVAGLPEQDLVWVDAPCTGSGIFRRHPDVRWIRRDKDLEALTKLQLELLNEARTKVRPGGFLAYSVCSVLAEEGPEIIRKAGFESSVLQTWALGPHLSPYGDGFWAALIGVSS